MVHVSIVEDDPVSAQTLEQYFAQYQRERDVAFQITCYQNGAAFLEHYSPETDLVLMDIDLPVMDGMKTAAALRDLDRLVVLIFVTNLAQYAVQGYEVNALDYIVKPVPYAHFAVKLERALQNLPSRQESYIIRSRDGVIRVACDRIFYVEGQRHKVLFHTADGVIPVWGTLKETEQALRRHGFSRSGHSFLLNLRHIQAIHGSRVLLHGQEFSIGRSHKAAFMDDFTAFLGGSGQ